MVMNYRYFLQKGKTTALLRKYQLAKVVDEGRNLKASANTDKETQNFQQSV